MNDSDVIHALHDTVRSEEMLVQLPWVWKWRLGGFRGGIAKTER
jgi:hypothetical protein